MGNGCQEMCHRAGQILCLNYDTEHKPSQMREICDNSGKHFELMLSEVFREGLESD